MLVKLTRSLQCGIFVTGKGSGKSSDENFMKSQNIVSFCNLGQKIFSKIFQEFGLKILIYSLYLIMLLSRTANAYKLNALNRVLIKITKPSPRRFIKNNHKASLLC